MSNSRMRTRGKGSGKSDREALAAAVSSVPKFLLKPESSNPPKVFILPRDATPEARIITFENPRTSLETRYLYCPEKGFYEYTKVAEPRATPRSWLLAPCEASEADRKRRNGEVYTSNDDGDYIPSKGYVTKTAEMFITTPIDPLFLVLPALAPASSSQTSDSVKRLFLASDDYLDIMVSKSPHFRTLLHTSSTQKRIETRMRAVCDTVEAGDETMYRLNETKLLEELLQKARRMVEHGLPPSMEEKLIVKTLETPMLNLKREESFVLGGVGEGEAPSTSGMATPSTDCLDSQTTTSSTDTLATSTSFASTAATSISEADGAAEASRAAPDVAAITAPPGIPELLRLRTALNFITATYLPAHLQDTLQALLQSTSPSSLTVDFAPLDAHLSYLAGLRQQVLASRALGDYSRKRSLHEDEEARADKKRKKEEEEKRRRAGESRGVRELKKVNVKGMKKMSDFFARKG